MAKRTKKAVPNSAPQPESLVDEENSAPDEKFIRALEDAGVVHTADFQQNLLEALKTHRTRPFIVRDLLKSFRLRSKQSEFLNSLRKQGIARPKGGGPWTADSTIFLTRKGFDLAQECDVNPRPLIFVSYSRKDQQWRDRLIEHLTVIEHGINIDVWYDQRVGIGGEWYTEIADALDRSEAVVLLISASFLNSEFINNEELPIIQQKISSGCQVFPVLARPCAWQTVDWLQKLQIRPNDGRALSTESDSEVDEDLTQVTLEIHNDLIQRL